MGICLYMGFDNGSSCPFWFTKSDSKALVWYIVEVENGPGAFPDTIGKLADQFGVNIKPLLKIGGQDFSIEEFGGNETAFKQYQKSNKAAWQKPQDLIDCLQTFVNKLDNEPDIFAKLKVEDDYFLSETFKQDLIDLIHMAEWAKENEVKKIRLEAA